MVTVSRLKPQKFLIKYSDTFFAFYLRGYRVFLLYSYHNAWIKSFHAQIKKEYIYRRTIKDVTGSKEACFNYIEGFYNTIKSQEVLGYKSPNEFEAESMQLLSA